jgi:circadian clock protein KaiB
MQRDRLPEFGIEDKIVLKLYVTGMSEKSMEAVENIHRLCDEYLEGAFELEIVDLYKNPDEASGQQIISSPSLIKRSPPPVRTLAGTFSDSKKVMRALGITVKR